jgi:fatty-acyl-CoA synthase
VSELPTVTSLLAPLIDVEEQGVYFGDTFTSWRDHIRQGAAVAAHCGIAWIRRGRRMSGCCCRTRRSSPRCSSRRGCSGIVPVGLNPVRRGAALQRDVTHADCQVVLADSASAAVLDQIDHVNVDSVEWADELAAHADAAVVAQTAEPEDLFMLIFTSGTSGEPKAVKCSQGKVAIAGATMTQRFELGPSDVCYVSMPLFHSNAVLVGWAVAVAARASMALRPKFSASQFLPDIRRYGATYANYVGKPLSYVLATPERPDDADNPLRAVYGNEGAPGDIERFAERFGTVVTDGFGSTEGGVAIARTPDTPPGSLGPLPEGTEILDVDTGEPCPPGVTGEIVNVSDAGRFEGYYNDPDADAEPCAAASTTAATWPTRTKTDTSSSRAGLVTGCVSTAKTSAPHPSNGCCCATPTSWRQRCSGYQRSMSATE